MIELLHGQRPVPIDKESEASLLGIDPEEYLIGAWMPQPTGTRIVVYQKIRGELVERLDPLTFYFHLSDRRLLDDCPENFVVTELDGEGALRFCVMFDSLSKMWNAVRHINRRIQALPRPFPEQTDDILHVEPDPVIQYFLQTGQTCFKGLEPEDLAILRVSIVTSSLSGYSNPERASDEVLAVALADSTGWRRILSRKRKDEEKLLRLFIDLVRERNPDIIEGFHLHTFELPFLFHRCRMYGIEMSLGRDGSNANMPPGQQRDQRRAQIPEIHGRHLIDLSRCVGGGNHGDRTRGQTGLVRAVRAAGLDRPERVVLDPRQVSWCYQHDYRRFEQFLHDNLSDLELLSERYTRFPFETTRMFPLNYQQVPVTGSARKIDLLMEREYMHRNHALPAPSSGTLHTGGLTGVFACGVFNRIIHVDVESLYPSLMLSWHIKPRSDTRGMFLSLLERLTDLRLDIKRRMMNMNVGRERENLEALQSAYKILINSFFGYLAYPPAMFNDFERAEEVTQTGQEILRQVVTELKDAGAEIIEIDTDGVFAIPPPGIETETDEQNLVKNISTLLPERITLGFAGRYEKIFSYKIKNYALLTYDQKLIIRGSSLHSRSMERFARDFIRDCIECILRGDFQTLHGLYTSLIFDIRNHKIHVRDLARTEEVKIPLRQYMEELAREQRKHSGLMEAIRRAGRPVSVGERISYYYTGQSLPSKPYTATKLAELWDPNFPDANVAWYQKRVRDLAEKFRPFFEPEDFQQIFSEEEGLFPIDNRAVTLRMLREEPPDFISEQEL